ncbi:hypothetical protein FB45DRAFT_730809 [Roridomyces roridus]|uniref:Uncharacterized protein n=1 Tax=Roridomyces roridus TaxID=1738132 RepID=A0AAD7CHW4_9AGAR|nr:hypothetical protein FB45DRAFT_730809 [Roridomyces roridus]
MKEGGVVTDEVRDALTDLVALDNVPAKRAVSIFRRIGAFFGVHVEDDVSRRSVSRFVKEGGNAAKLQFVEATQTAKGITLAGDGTSHKNETYETKFATIINDSSDENRHLQFFLGIQMAVNHTSQTQLDGWIELIEELYHLGMDSGILNEEDSRDFWNLVTGFQSDHANDQKRLFELMKEHKERCERDIRGEEAVLEFSIPELNEFLFKVTDEAIRDAGGFSAWDALSDDEQKSKINEIRQRVVRDIGQEEFNKLTDAEKSDVDLFLWAGCCMHKEMNAFKGGAHAMSEFWTKRGLTPPMKLFNRDNAAAAKATGTDAAQRAEDLTLGGAIKLASLCGAIFRHKDRKRGQQDTLRFYFDLVLGFTICFPDTNNTRFQSHEEACAVLITYLDIFIEFLEYVRKNKQKRTLNHMENNVFQGLQDIPTRHEICVVTLYYLSVSVPYMREIRGREAATDNVLELTDLHERVISHIDELIDHPEYLLSATQDAYIQGSLDGKPWSRPEAFWAVQRYAPTLPHLRDLLVAFLIGARDKWIDFSEEFSPDGALAGATLEQIARAWMRMTNDLCEGEFGTWRQSAKANPSLSVVQHNSRQMYKFNNTSEYLRALGPEMRKFLRKVTRQQDESGASRAMRIKLAKHRQAVAEENTEKDRVRAAKVQAARDALEEVAPILTITELHTDYFTVADITEQLRWHAEFGAPESRKGKKKRAPKQAESEEAPTKTKATRETKFQSLEQAVEQYISSGLPRDPLGRLGTSWEAEKMEDSLHELVTVDDLDGYDSEGDYYQR